MQERVIGQADAVSAVSRAMKRARTGLKDPRRPIAAMLFAGPTGVGKTELTKVCSPLESPGVPAIQHEPSRLSCLQLESLCSQALLLQRRIHA